jgi:hypothetical protein
LRMTHPSRFWNCRANQPNSELLLYSVATRGV